MDRTDLRKAKSLKTFATAPPSRDRYLRTDDLLPDLADRTLRSAAIQISTQLITLALFVASGMVLARLLTPNDYGLFAMVMTLIAFVGTFKDYGLTMATVHHESLDHGQVSAVFWLGLKLSLATVAGVALMAPVVARFYGEPLLVPITFAMAAGLFGIALGHQHESLLVRRLEFLRLRQVDLASIVLGIGVAVALAAAGAGVWSLVAQFVVAGTTRTAGLWWACGWRPSRRGPRALAPDIRALVAYGWNVTGSRVLLWAARNLDRLLVGRFAGAAVLGLYDNALRWAMYPVTQVYAPLMNVAVAGLSRYQSDGHRYRAAWRLGMLPLFTVVLPALVFLTVEARAAILVLLGDQWLGAVPFFRVLCLAAVAASVERTLKWIYLSRGNTARQLRWALIATPLMMAAVAIGLRWGALGVAIGFATGAWLLLPGAIAFCLRHSPVRWRDFGAVAGRPGLAAIAAAGVLLALDGWIEPASPLLELVVGGGMFGAVYAGVWVSLPGGPAAMGQLQRLIRELFPRRTSGSEEENGRSA